MNNIIDDPIELSKLSRDEIDDILLQVKYNKANLRELIRSCILTIRSKNKEIEYYKKELEEAKKHSIRKYKLVK